MGGRVDRGKRRKAEEEGGFQGEPEKNRGGTVQFRLKREQREGVRKERKVWPVCNRTKSL